MKKKSSEQEPVKMGVRGWAREFHLSEVTLRRALAKAGEQSDERDLYATSQIVSALYTPTAEQRAQLLRAKVEGVKAKNAALAAELIPVKEIARCKQVIYEAIEGEIESCSELSADQKSKLLRHLRSLRSRHPRPVGNDPETRCSQSL